MKLVFAHDHRFAAMAGSVYSENHFAAGFWDRYLGSFDRLTVMGRRAEPTGADCRATMLESSREDVDFALLPSLSSPRGALLERRSTIARIRQIVGNHDAVVARLPSEIGLATLRAARALGVPAAIEVVGCAYDAHAHYGTRLGALYAPLARYRMRQALDQATHAIYVTQHFLQQRYPAPHAVIQTASNVELAPLDMRVLERRLQRMDDGSDRPLVLGLVGSLRTRMKGIQVALRALADRHGELPDFRFRILGGGDRSGWEAEAAKAGLADRVSFDGAFPDQQRVLDWLDEIDLYLQPSLQEGLPRALIEAMSRGCPALGSDLAGIPELLDPADLARPGDAGDLGELIVRRGGDRAWMAARARRNFEAAGAYEQWRIDARRQQFWTEFADYARAQASAGPVRGRR